MSERDETDRHPDRKRLTGALETILEVLLGERLDAMQGAIGSVEERLTEHLGTVREEIQTAVEAGLTEHAGTVQENIQAAVEHVEGQLGPRIDEVQNKVAAVEQMKNDLGPRMDEVQGVVSEAEQAHRAAMASVTEHVESVRAAAEQGVRTTRDTLGSRIEELEKRLADAEQARQSLTDDVHQRLKESRSLTERSVLVLRDDLGPRIDEIADRLAAATESYETSFADVAQRINETRAAIDDRSRVVQERIDRGVEQKHGEFRTELNAIADRVTELRQDLEKQAATGQRVSAVLQKLSSALTLATVSAGAAAQNVAPPAAAPAAEPEAQQAHGERPEERGAAAPVSNGDVHLEETLDEMLSLGQNNPPVDRSEA